MNYKIDIEGWKTLVDIHSNALSRGPLLVLNVNEKFDPMFGQGPYNMAFAWRDSKGTFMSYESGNEICGDDFRDSDAHNVGSHSGKVTHGFDAWDISCLVIDLLTQNEELKQKLKAT